MKTDILEITLTLYQAVYLHNQKVKIDIYLHFCLDSLELKELLTGNIVIYQLFIIFKELLVLVVTTCLGPESGPLNNG